MSDTDGTVTGPRHAAAPGTSAHELVLTAVEHLDLTGPQPDPQPLALHGTPLRTAGYATQPTAWDRLSGQAVVHRTALLTGG